MSEPIPNPEDEPLLMSDEVAAWARVGVSTVYRWVESGALEAVRFDRAIRFERPTVRAFIANRRTKKPALQIVNEATG